MMMSKDARIILETISDGMPRVVVQWVVFILRPFRPQVPGWRLNPLVVVLSVGWRGECIYGYGPVCVFIDGPCLQYAILFGILA